MGPLSNQTVESRVPAALERDTIAESIFEIRFAPALEDAGDLLPGMLYPALKSGYPSLTRLPVAEMPKTLRQAQQNLAFTPLHRLLGKGRNVSVGDRVLSLSLTKPYPGWAMFREAICEVMAVLQGTGIVSSVERVALRYSNILQIGADETDLSPLDISLRLNSFDRRGPGTHVRSEVELDDCINIIQIATSANIRLLDDQQLSGVLLDIDSQKTGPFTNFWESYTEVIEDIHTTEKAIFFGLLTESSIEKLGPKW